MGAHRGLRQYRALRPGRGIWRSASAPVSADLTGLTKGLTYHYRLVVANPSGALDGRDETFSASEAPTVGGQFVSNVHSDSAELHGYVDPEGAEPHIALNTARTHVPRAPVHRLRLRRWIGVET